MAEYLDIDPLRLKVRDKMQADHDRHTRGMDEPTPDVVTIAAKEVDQERREMSDVLERMVSRQRYFFEKAQMLREAADHYHRMAEDLAELLNTSHIDKNNKSSDSYEH